VNAAAPRLTAALGNRYDTRYLIDGAITVDGFPLDFVDSGKHPWISFREMITRLPWDIGEQAFSHYLIARDQGRPLTAVPVFPGRFFPQLGAVVRRGAGIDHPRDLAGRRVGVMGFGYNPAVWLRGILERQYDVDPRDIIWVEDSDDRFFAGLDYPRGGYRVERMAGIDGLDGRGTTPGPVAALARGDIDACFAPAGGPPPDDVCQPLFEDRLAACESWLDAGGVLPINTVVTLRTETVERHPTLPSALYRAMVAARRRYHEATDDSDHMGFPYAWLEQRGLFPDCYGIETNREAIECMIDFCSRQGVIRTRPRATDLFCEGVAGDGSRQH